MRPASTYFAAYRFIAASRSLPEIQRAGVAARQTLAPASASTRGSVLWCDVDDFVAYARHAKRPSGIQRLCGELFAQLVQKGRDRVRFVAYRPDSGRFEIVDWPSVREVYNRMAGGRREAELPPTTSSVAIGARTPPATWWRFFTKAAPRAVSFSRAPVPALAELAQPGDILCTLGAPWHHLAYPRHVAELQNTRGIRFALMVHDLIPIVRPEFFDSARAPHFATVMKDVLQLADILLTNSRHTSNDVVTFATQMQLALRSQPRAIPIGTGFERPPASPLLAGLEPGQYALFVSTIEARKNHQQAFRVWCRLMRELPTERVPKLVFAGALGWMVDDLMKAIANTRNVEGKLVIVNEPDDAQLRALYENCRFTLFASHYEGWGLPVSDSLSFGKVCISSNRASMTEAGGPFCLYVDPEDNNEAYRVIRDAIENHATLTNMEARIRTSFVPTRWEQSADAVLAAAFEGSPPAAQ